MADAALVDRLANVRALKGVPRAELEWLADHGKIEPHAAGEVFRPKDYPIPGLAIMLSGAIAIHVDRMGIQRRIMQWHGGDITGLLPYSRMVVPPGDSVIHEDSVLFTVDKEHFRELTVAVSRSSRRSACTPCWIEHGTSPAGISRTRRWPR